MIGWCDVEGGTGDEYKDGVCNLSRLVHNDVWPHTQPKA